MQKKVTARHFDLTPEMKERAEAEMDGLTRYFDNIISAEFILDAERHRRMAELRVKVYNHTMTASGETDEIGTAMSQAVDKMKAQLKKYKGKLKDRKPEAIERATDKATRPEVNEDEVDQ